MKNEQRRNLIVLILVLLVLCGAFIGMKKWNQSKSEKNISEIAFQAKNITALSYQDTTGKQQSFEKKKDRWTYKMDESIQVKQDTVEEMAAAFGQIEAIRKITKPDALEDYGLETPQYRIQLTDQTGIHNLLIGDKTGEAFYFMEEGKTVVYTVKSELEDRMIWELKSLAEQEEFPFIDAKTFENMTIDFEDGVQQEIKADEEEAIVKDVTESLSNLYFTDCIEYHVTESTLSSYGLGEKERTTVTVQHQDKTTKFYIGDKDEKGEYYYVQLEGSQRVHRVLVSGIDKILAWS